MNPDAPKTPREEMEAWLTALLLGELSAGEAAAVRELMKHDAELARLHDRLKQSIALLREAEPKTAANPAPAEPLKLSEARRQRLLTAFKIPPLKPADRKPKPASGFRLVELMAVVAVVGVLAAMLFPAMNSVTNRERLDFASTQFPKALAAPTLSYEDDRAVVEKLGENVSSARRASGGSNVYSVDVVGYVPQPMEAPATISGRVQISGQVADASTRLYESSDSANAAGSALSRNLAHHQRRLSTEGRELQGRAETKSSVYAAAKPVAAAPVTTPAPTLVPQIVLPSTPAVAATELAPLPIQYPTPTLKGTPEDLPSSPNIEPLGETLATRGGALLKTPRKQSSARPEATRTPSSPAPVGGAMPLAQPPAPAASPAPAPPIVLPATPSVVDDTLATTVAVEPVAARIAVPAQTAVASPDSAGTVLYFGDSSVTTPPTAVPPPIVVAGGTESERLRERFAKALKDTSKLEEGRKSGGVAGGEWFAGDLGITSTNSSLATVGGSAVLSTNYFASFDGAVDNFAYGLYALTNPTVHAGSVRGFYNEGALGFRPDGVALDALARKPEDVALADGLSVPGAAPAAPIDPATGLPVLLPENSDDLTPGGGIYLGRGVTATTPRPVHTFGADADKVVLGDVPALGKLFRGSSVSGIPNGTIVSNGRTWELAGYNEPNQVVSPSLAGKDASRLAAEARTPTPYYRAKPPVGGGGVVTFGTAALAATNSLRQVGASLEKLRAGLALSDTDVAGSAPAPSIEADDLRRITAATKEGEVRLSALRTNVQKLKGLSPEQLAQVLPQVRSGPRLAELSGELKLVEQELSRAKENKSSRSSDRARLQTQAEELKRKLAVNTGAALSAMDSEAARLEHEVAGLKKIVADAQSYDVAKAKASRPYYDKKRELEELYGFSHILSTKLAAEGVDVKLQQQGSTSLVEVADRAVDAKEKTGFWRSLGAPVGGSYASKARVRVERDVTAIEGMAGSRAYSQYDPYFIQNEFETIRSEAVLGKVVELLSLNEDWAKQAGKSGKLKTTEAIGLLKSKLSLAPVRNTSYVEIKVESDDAKEATRIANAIADVYLNHRMQERLSRTTSGIKALEERYQEQQEKIKKATKELEQLRASLVISDTDAQGTAPAPALKVELDTPIPRKPSTNAPIPQPEIQTSENNFSTFSLNVSDVSFKLAMASLEQGQMPDAASVRSEEFINAFDYRDPEPAAGAPIAFAWERARYPFAHNRDLLRFSLKTAAQGRVNGRALNLVLLLDNSGSMERADRVQIIRQALHVLAEQLQPQDKLSVLTFARTPRLVADGISGDKAGEVTEAVAGLTPQGGTNLEEAMNLAYATALKHYLAGGINRVVLLTDGAANLGDVEPESLKNKVETHRRQGIALDAFGIGWEGYNDDLLEVLSRNGDGRYGFINSPEEAASEFAGQLAGALKVAASDVKVQVEFNPRRVTSYRQIGYAKHQLTKEQFRDNTVDAAEIAAQEAGNALYTVEVNPAGDGPLCTVRCRYKIPGTTDYHEHAWDVPYTGNALSLEQSSPAMRLGASAAAFSEWLVASPFAGEVTPDRVLGVLSGVPEVYGADGRPKKLEWMIRQAKSIEGK